MTKYWMVHKPGTECRYMHGSRPKAEAEAKRLIRENGGEYVIMEAVAVVKRVVPIEVVELDDFDELPF